MFAHRPDRAASFRGVNILHLTKSDAGGGAALGFLRIHEALLSQGHASCAIVRNGTDGVEGISTTRGQVAFPRSACVATKRLAMKALRLLDSPVGVFDVDAEAVVDASTLVRMARRLGSRWDLVMVHWAGGFVSPQTVAEVSTELGAPIGLWQVDMAHLTGGCHYSMGCHRYESGCGHCPSLGWRHANDRSATQAAARQRVWQHVRPIIIAQSVWSAHQAKTSWVLRADHVIVAPIPVDEARFAVPDRSWARAELGVSPESPVMLVRSVGLDVAYKGMPLLLEALRKLVPCLAARGMQLTVAAFGHRGLWPHDVPGIQWLDLGEMHGERALAQCYAASDFLVSPSIQDAGPMVISEAMLAGCPIVAFPVGLAADFVEPGVTGELAERTGSVEDLAQCILRMCEKPRLELRRMGDCARQRVASELHPARFCRTLESGLQAVRESRLAR